jgi:hypothetical protein
MPWGLKRYQHTGGLAQPFVDSYRGCPTLVAFCATEPALSERSESKGWEYPNGNSTAYSPPDPVATSGSSALNSLLDNEGGGGYITVAFPPLNGGGAGGGGGGGANNGPSRAGCAL